MSSFHHVDQSKLYTPDGIHNGNCLAACLASMLGIPLWMVPPFDAMFGRNDWRVRVDEWLEKFFKMSLVRYNGHPVPDLPALYIANGPSSRGVYHSTIYSDGFLVHDPHPSREGLKQVEWCWALVPLEPQA